MVDFKKLGWGIAAIIASIIVTDFGLKLFAKGTFNRGMMILAIIFFIGALIGAVFGIKEIIQAIKGK